MIATTVKTVDALRIVAIVIAVIGASQIPGLMSHRIHGWRSWLIIFMIEVLFVSVLYTVLRRFSHKLVWYGTPLLFIAGLLGTIYALSIWNRPRKKGK